MMSRTAITGMIILLGVGIGMATEAPPTRRDAYDGVAPDGRAIAMGGAFASIANSPAAVFYNPAGLIGVTGNFFSVTIEATRQSELTTDQIFDGEALRDRSVGLLALTSPKGSFTWRPLCNERARVSTGSDWTEHEVKIDALTVAAAQEASPGFATGLSLSYLMGRIGTSSVINSSPTVNISDGNGMSVDLGFLWKLSSQLRAGLDLRNLFGMMWWDDYAAEQLPFQIRAGFSFNVQDFFIFSTDWEKKYYRKGIDTSPETVHFGIEQHLGQVLAVRLGTFSTDLNNKEATHVTAGLGYASDGYSLSLAGEKYRVSATDVFRYVFSLDVPLGASSGDAQ